MTTRVFSLALAAATALTASTAAFSEDTPNQIRVVSSQSWGSGCPDGKVEVTHTKQRLFGPDIYDSISIFFGEAGDSNMAVEGYSFHLDREEVFCTTKLTMKVPAGYTLGELSGFQNGDFFSNNIHDRLYIRSWVDVSDLNLLNPIRKYEHVLDPVASNREIIIDFGNIGDLNDAFCHDDRYATITLTTKLVLEYEVLDNNDIPYFPNATLQGTYFKLKPSGNSNAVKCNAASGWRWF